MDLGDIPSRIDRFDIIELNELRQFLKEYQFERFNYINKLLILKSDYTLEWAVNNISQYGLNYNNLVYLMDLINSRIKKFNDQSLVKTEKRKFKRAAYDNEIFKGAANENLFFYCLENRSFDLNNKNVGGIYSWFCKYLNCTKLDFARYWNTLDTGYKIPIGNKSDAKITNIDVEHVSKDLDSLNKGFSKIS